MKKLVNTYLIGAALFILVAVFITSCRNGVTGPPPTPPLLSYNTYAYGNGTDNYSGAVSFQINPYSSYYNYAYFQIQVYGIGTFNLPGGSNQLFLPYLLPGSYSFTINIYCDNNGSGCPPESLNGVFYIYEATTTQVLAQP